MSAVFHGLALAVTLGLMAQVKQAVPKDPFTWNVSLVEPQRSQETRQAEIMPTQEPAKPTLRPIAPSPSQPKMVSRECTASRGDAGQGTATNRGSAAQAVRSRVGCPCPSTGSSDC